MSGGEGAVWGPLGLPSFRSWESRKTAVTDVGAKVVGEGPNGGRGVLMMGYLYVGEGSHWRGPATLKMPSRGKLSRLITLPPPPEQLLIQMPSLPSVSHQE